MIFVFAFYICSFCFILWDNRIEMNEKRDHTIDILQDALKTAYSVPPTYQLPALLLWW